MASSTDVGGVPAADDEPEATPKEVRAWYTIDFANSVFSTVGISGFLPLLVQSAALANAGFPAVCRNVVRDAAAIARAFNGTGVDPLPSSMFYLSGFVETPCTAGQPTSCTPEGWCPGLPASVGDCRLPDGKTVQPLRTSTGADPTGFAALGISVSVAVQVFVFIAIGSLADYGPLRKRLLLWASAIGSLGSILCATIGPDSWWTGLPLMCVTNVAFGVTGIVYNAYLPRLVDALPAVRAAKAAASGAGNSAAATAGPAGPGAVAVELAPTGAGAASTDVGSRSIEKQQHWMSAGSAADTAAPAAVGVSERGGTSAASAPVTSTSTSASAPSSASSLPQPSPLLPLHELELAESTSLSSKGFAWGYTAGVIGIALCLPFVLVLPTEMEAYRAAMVVCGVWWAAFMYTPWRDLHTRPGPPLPPGVSYLRQSWLALRETVADLRGLPDTLLYLAAWALFSDGVFVIGTLGGLFANAEVDWGCTPRALGILAMFFLVPLTGAAGNMGLLYLARRYGWHARTALQFCLLGVLLIPLYAMVGYLTPSFGLRKGWEVILVGAWYGLLMAPMQAFSRSLFASLIPKGKESGCYAAYELTNRGSSWLGPLVLTLVQQTTGDVRRGFIYVIVAIGVGMAILSRVDFNRGRQAAVEAAAVGAVGPASQGQPGAGGAGAGPAASTAAAERPGQTLLAAGAHQGHAADDWQATVA